MRYIVVLTTVEDKGEAENIAKKAVEARLAACVQIYGPITSIYRWKGRVEEAEEWVCLFKTKATIYEELEEFLVKEHPYKVPEIIALPISKGFKQYLKWVEDGTCQKKSPEG